MNKLMILAALAASAAIPVCAADDWTISDDTVLTEDKTVGALLMENSKTLDLGGHSLTASSITASSGGGYVIDNSGTYAATIAPAASDEQYIYGTGKLWINTGVVPECTDTFETKIYIEGSVLNTYLWTARDANQKYCMNCYDRNSSGWKFQFHRGGETTVTAISSSILYQQKYSYEITANYGTG